MISYLCIYLSHPSLESLYPFNAFQFQCLTCALTVIIMYMYTFCIILCVCTAVVILSHIILMIILLLQPGESIAQLQSSRLDSIGTLLYLNKLFHQNLPPVPSKPISQIAFCRHMVPFRVDGDIIIRGDKTKTKYHRYMHRYDRNGECIPGLTRNVTG